MRAGRTRRAIALFVPPALVIVVCGAIWQLVAFHNRFAIPTLSAIGASLWDNPGFYFANAEATLEELAVGLFVSFFVAFFLAGAMTYVRVVERAVMPLAVVLNVTPVVSYAPGLTIIFGLGITPRYIVAALIVFFPFLVNSLVGLRSADPEALEFFHTLDASPSEILFRLRLPSSLPFLFAAARICVPLSLIGAVVAEFTTSGSSRGLGSQIVVAQNSLALPTIYAAVFCLAVIGLLLTGIVVAAERRVLSWHWSSQPRTN